MKSKINRFKEICPDKSIWGEGEWVNEKDIYDGTYKNYDYIIGRNPKTGAFVGYVEVPISKKQINFKHLKVHGGITWNELRLPYGFRQLYFDNNKDDSVDFFYIGFDACHSTDLIPSIKSGINRYNLMENFKDTLHVSLTKLIDMVEDNIDTSKNDIYRNIDYMINECHKIIDQLEG